MKSSIPILVMAFGVISSGAIAATAPSVTTQPATSITANSATLNANVNANSSAGGTWFEWGGTVSYGNRTPTNAIPAINFNFPQNANIAGLTPNTTYHFRCVATNAQGAGTGSDQSFTTLIPSPSASTLAATLVTSNGATLNGSWNPNGIAAVGWFEWGTNTSYGNTSTQYDLGSGTVTVTNLFPLSSLASGVTYHFRATASNSTSVAHGGDRTFRTSPGYFTVTTLADSGPGSLRGAISNSRSGDFISFGTNGTIVLTNGELLITNSLTITGPGASNLAISGNQQSRVFELATNASLILSGVTIRDGRAPDGNDGTTNSTAAGAGGNGGGVLNGGTLILSNAVVQLNRAGNGGVGGPSGAGGHGGGLFNSGTATVTSCSISDNVGGRGGDGTLQFGNWYYGGVGGFGAGIFNSGTLTLANSTVAYNTAGEGGTGAGHGGVGGSRPDGSGGTGGGIYSAGRTTIVACTISQNAAQVGYDGFQSPIPQTGGIQVESPSSQKQIGSSIVSSNATGYPYPSGNDTPDLSGDFISLGHNLIRVIGNSYTVSGIMNGQNGDQAGNIYAPLDPALGPLTNNGGQTLTMAILSTSPAFNAGDDTLLGPPYNLSADQRGHPRKSGQQVDIGAYEFDLSEFSDPTAITQNATTAPPNGGNGNSPITFYGTVNPGGLPAAAWFQFGLTTNYGGFSPTNAAGSGTSDLIVASTTPAVASGHTYHYRAVAANVRATVFGSDQTVRVPSTEPVGDLNGDGIVDQNELNTVLSNYWPNSSWVYMTNTAGLGTSNVTFALTNTGAWAFTVLASTNLTDWQSIGLANPVYQFFDPDASSNGPQRYYRLRWP